MKVIIILFFFISTLPVYSQKAGGVYLRIDDPFQLESGGDITTDSTYILTTLQHCDTLNKTITWAIICDYPFIGGGNPVPTFTIYGDKRRHLKRLQDSGHILSCHTINHTTNYYQCHVDSLSSSDSALAYGTYSETDGIDTIIINNTASSVTLWYWKRFPDDRHRQFGYFPIEDEDDLPDSIYYYRKIPPYTVYFSIYPNTAGLKRMLREYNRRFTASGLDTVDFFIHPGQEYTYTYDPTDSLKESSGYIETSVGVDDITYHIADTFCSKPHPVVSNKLLVGGTKYVLRNIVKVNDTAYDAELFGYTGDGSNHDAIMYPTHPADWMWQIPPDTIKSLVNEGILVGASVYPDGRQYESLGFTPSATTKSNFKNAHQWGHFDIVNDGTTTSIQRAIRAGLCHYFIGNNDHHQLKGTNSAIDSLYELINSTDQIQLIDLYDLRSTLYNSTPNRYTNIVPSLDSDIDSDDNLDGYETTGSPVWQKDSVHVGDDTTFVTIDASNYIELNDLWGVEKGTNRLSFYVRSQDATCDELTITVTKYTHTLGTSATSTTSTQTFNVRSIPRNFVIRYRTITIDSDVDWIDIDFETDGGNADIADIKMILQ